MTVNARPRLASVDIVRGAVMVLMAIDHVRVYSGVPAGGPTPGIFFTRWVTHFCAPLFVFLAGTAVFLQVWNRRARSSTSGVARVTGWSETGAVARQLVARGVVLVLLELTVIRASWTFGFDYSQFILAGVIWMIGWCMVILAALLWLPTWAVGTIGLMVIGFQHIFGAAAGALPEAWRWLWEFVYPVGAEVRIGEKGPSVAVLYSIVPWVGVMAAGYGFGAVLVREPAERRRLCLMIGLTAIALFLAATGVSLLTSAPADASPAFIRILNQRKYPASILFLLMTLGPAIAILPVAERARGWLAEVLRTFGRVPMFYYLLHIPLIHATALLVRLFRDGRVDAAQFATAPFVSIPEQQRWGLPLLYIVFVVVVALLYVPCRWFARVKANSSSRWLRYI